MNPSPPIPAPLRVYSENEKHPDLHLHKEIIRSGEELIRRMKKEKR